MSFLFSKARFVLVALGVCCVVAGSCLPSAFGKNTKRYTIESGEVHYKVQGTGNIMGTQISSSGEKKLYFRNHGSLIMEERIVKESTSGLAGNRQETQHSMSKTDRSKIYNVDFQKKQISVISDPGVALYEGTNMGDDAEKFLKGLGGKKIGSDNVLGHTCTIWSVPDGKQCMYKNQVPLWLEVNVMGIKTKEVAVSAKFNHHISDKYFQLPNYPVKKDFGGSTQSMSKQETDLVAIMQALGQEEQWQGNENGLEQQLMSASGQNPQINNELDKIKHEMPTMLQLLKVCRSCLQEANSKREAQYCGERMEQERQKLGMSQDLHKEDWDEEFFSWSVRDKKKTLAELDQAIANMEKSMPCIKRAKTLMDLMNCQETDN